MNQDLKTFAFSVLRVVMAVLLSVASLAFVTMPYALGHHPGDAGHAVPASVGHMT